MSETAMAAVTKRKAVTDAPPVTIPEGRPRLLHVKCPQGHRLEAPCVLDGQDVVCPYCSSRFPFAYSESDEFRQERRRASNPSNQSAGHQRVRWQEWAVVALVIASVVVVVHQLLIRWP